MAGQQERILLVEDDPAIAAIIVDLLEDAAFEVDGPYATLSEGVAAVASNLPDGAVLDMRLEGSDVGMLADDLESYDIPFIFCSGMDRDALARRFAGRPFVSKPGLVRTLIPSLRRILH
ncbi:MAG: response regulator [Sphingobium sp.]